MHPRKCGQPLQMHHPPKGIAHPHQQSPRSPKPTANEAPDPSLYDSSANAKHPRSVTAPGYLFHHIHTSTNTRGCGSSSGMHCDVARRPSLRTTSRASTEAPWVMQTNHGGSFLQTKGPANKESAEVVRRHTTGRACGCGRRVHECKQPAGDVTEQWRVRMRRNGGVSE